VVLAGGGGALPALVRPIRAFVGGALGSGQQWMSWIHLQDLVHLILWAIDHDTVKDSVNGVAPEPVRQREMVRTIGRILRRPVWLDAPGTVLKLGLGRMAKEMLLEGQRVLPKRAQTAGFEWRFQHLEAALRDLLER
jgi:uncharacterized protein (TIGR01777 family)